MTTTIHSQEDELPRIMPEAKILLDAALLHYRWLPNNFRFIIDVDNRRIARLRSDITLERIKK